MCTAFAAKVLASALLAVYPMGWVIGTTYVVVTTPAIGVATSNRAK